MLNYVTEFIVDHMNIKKNICNILVRVGGRCKKCGGGHSG